MLVTIERKRLGPHRLYGVIVNESEQLICLHREVDFQLDGYVFIRKKDITSHMCYTPSHKYTEALMRKEGFWLKPDRFVQRLNIDSWETTVTSLIANRSWWKTRINQLIAGLESLMLALEQLRPCTVSMVWEYLTTTLIEFLFGR